MFFDRYEIHIQAFGYFIHDKMCHLPILIFTNLYKIDTHFQENENIGEHKQMVSIPFQKIQKLSNLQVLRYEK